MDDSIHLRLFQCTLTGPSTKWYVDEKSGSHVTFKSLAFFQLPGHHETGIKLLFECKQTSIAHIYDHIHEWRQRHSLCKVETTKEQRINWFLKSLVSILAKYVASTFPQSKEYSITKAQHFNLIYAQSGYLYIVIPNAPRHVPFGQEKPGMSHATDELIGTTTHHNLYIRTPPMYGTPQYPLIYGRPYYYPPPLYQQPYHVSPPPPMSGPLLTPIMRPTSQPSSGSSSTSAYNLGTSESASPSYIPYGLFP
jgi:hypothetical protein